MTVNTTLNNDNLPLSQFFKTYALSLI